MYIKPYIKSIKYLTQDELKRLLEVITDKRDRAIFLIAYRHGLRTCEIGMLKLEDVDLARGRIRIERAKHSIGGEYVMQRDEIMALESWLSEREDIYSPCLFPSKRGIPISRRMLDYLMKKYGREAEIPPDKRHFHVLKHSIATHLLEAGADIRFVQDWIGHANINNTVIYTHICNKFRDEQAMKVFTNPKIVGLEIHSANLEAETLINSESEALNCKSCGFPLAARDFNKTHYVYLCVNSRCQRYQEPQQSRRKPESRHTPGKVFEDVSRQRLQNWVIIPSKKVGASVP